ncbi:hypothetical protein [Phytohalomonas tamaricis]|uniref:hypothetical protein n=1 Tax=Phytohalomonas tamaricis TaxID=2081032 RepID=UPI000D0BB6DB|nr:hypothetical protein [Phytohalomonas tamaricis]
MMKYSSAIFATALLVFSMQASAAGSNQENNSTIGVPDHGITNMSDDEDVREAVKERAAEVSSSGMEADGVASKSNYSSENTDTSTGPRGSGEKRQGTVNSSHQGAPGEGNSQAQGGDLSVHGDKPNESTNSSH